MASEADTIQVVCIEDEPEMIDLVRLILTRRDGKTGQPTYRVSGANGGREGLKLIEEVKPDLVLLDLMMPDMDGWEVYQQMKNREAMKEIPVIIITAKAQSIDRVLGLHIAKVNAYVTKPFGPRELLAAVENVLREQGRLKS
jgi:DNA-binding response OmpR family regulator